MKSTTESILQWINNKTVKEQLNQFRDINPSYSFNEASINEMVELLEFNKSLILKSIEQSIFDTQVTFSKRQQILSNLKSISNQLAQISKAPFKYNAGHPNAAAYSQAIFNGILAVADTVESAKLQERIQGFANYAKEIKEIAKTRKAYNNLNSTIDKTKSLNNTILSLFEEIKSINASAKQRITEIETERNNLIKLKEDINQTAGTITKAQQEIEDKKLKINSFHNNIEDYQKSLSELEQKATDIIKKDDTIESLIVQAEQALKLKSAEGISAAFSSYLESSSKKKTLRNWMIGAGAFVGVALILTIWVVSGKWIDSPNELSSIIGRVVAVGISITGATFCANQYVKQKNILEDYSYKSVLSKSIVAFTDEIKKRDEGTKVAEYLTQVLAEIHKDPLRIRDNKEDKATLLNSELVNKLKDLIEVLEKKQ